METIKQLTVNALLGLPDTANFADIATVLETLRQQFAREVESEARLPAREDVSAYELVKDYIGCIEGPPDLSTNKAYFEGFGE
jgi:hypothetical protein